MIVQDDHLVFVRVSVVSAGNHVLVAIHNSNVIVHPSVVVFVPGRNVAFKNKKQLVL